MRVPIRTLTPKDAEILARTLVRATASKGYVERHGLRWRSDVLREWELVQRNLGRPREVKLLIDELDLETVYVELPPEDGKQPVKLRALSTQPMYTKDLSLYEHEKMKAVLKKKNLECRLVRMEDSVLHSLRLEYYALLGHQDDPISARRLEKLRDQLAERRLDAAAKKSRNAEVIEEALPYRDIGGSLPVGETQAPAEVNPKTAIQKRTRKEPRKGTTTKPSELSESLPGSRAANAASLTPAVLSLATHAALSQPTPRGVKTKPTYPSTFFKRIPK